MFAKTASPIKETTAIATPVICTQDIFGTIDKANDLDADAGPKLGAMAEYELRASSSHLEMHLKGADQ